MRSHEHTQGKLDLIKYYYEEALQIFANQSRKISISTNKDGVSFIVDAFCGSGIYKNGSLGSPLILLEEYSLALKKYPELRGYVKFIFNDKHEKKVNDLRERIEENPRWSKLLPFIEFRDLDFVKLLDEITELEIGGNKNFRTSYIVDPYGYEFGFPEFVDMLNNPTNEAILNIMSNFFLRFTTHEGSKSLEFLESILTEEDMHIFQKVVNSESENEGKYLQKITETFMLLFPHSLKSKGICNYITQHEIRRSESQTWYIIAYLGHRSKGKDVFDIARHKLPGNTKYFNPKRSDIIQTSLDSEDISVAIKPADALYMLNVKQIVNMIPKLFVESRKKWMTIEDIIDKCKQHESVIPTVGFGKRTYKWLDYIIPSAIDFFDELEWGSDTENRRSRKAIVLYIDEFPT